MIATIFGGVTGMIGEEADVGIEHLAAEVQAFFVKLRNGPLDRRGADDPDYRGTERRVPGARSGSDRDRKVA